MRKITGILTMMDPVDAVGDVEMRIRVMRETPWTVTEHKIDVPLGLGDLAPRLFGCDVTATVQEQPDRLELMGIIEADQDPDWEETGTEENPGAERDAHHPGGRGTDISLQREGPAQLLRRVNFQRKGPGPEEFNREDPPGMEPHPQEVAEMAQLVVQEMCTGIQRENNRDNLVYDDGKLKIILDSHAPNIRIQIAPGDRWKRTGVFDATQERWHNPSRFRRGNWTNHLKRLAEEALALREEEQRARFDQVDDSELFPQD